jgi:hypothetical protein
LLVLRITKYLEKWKSKSNLTQQFISQMTKRKTILLFCSVYLRYIRSKEPFVTSSGQEEVKMASFPCSPITNRKPNISLVEETRARRHDYLETNLDESLDFVTANRNAARDNEEDLETELSKSDTGFEEGEQLEHIDDDDDDDDNDDENNDNSDREQRDDGGFAGGQPMSKTMSTADMENYAVHPNAAPLQRSNTLPSQLVGSIILVNLTVHKHLNASVGKGF